MTSYKGQNIPVGVFEREKQAFQSHLPGGEVLLLVVSLLLWKKVAGQDIMETRWQIGSIPLPTGLYKKLPIDLGSDFQGYVFMEACQMGVIKARTTLPQPQTSGQVKCLNFCL